MGLNQAKPASTLPSFAWVPATEAEMETAWDNFLECVGGARVDIIVMAGTVADYGSTDESGPQRYPIFRRVGSEVTKGSRPLSRLEFFLLVY